MSDILLTTLNARYSHTAFGLRSLLANLGELRHRASLLEFEWTDSIEWVAETLLKQTPRIIGIGVYIWNVEPCTRLVTLLKQIQPDLVIILGGPEVSHETEDQSIVKKADYVICGEGEESFLVVCKAILAGKPPLEKILFSNLPELQQLQFPYADYLDSDIQNRVIYVELSRGCPYQCTFCLSALDGRVRWFPLDSFLSQMQLLLDRGVKNFKFVDRTFNLKIEQCVEVLDFFLERLKPGLFLHFELVPDHLPSILLERIQRFPPGVLQFEIGIQSFNLEVQRRIQRKQDPLKTLENLNALLQKTKAHIHTDLIVGLPSESLHSFAQGFDQLARINPHEIQVGILKKLRGTPLYLESERFGMVYNPEPPYDLLFNDLLDFFTLRRLKRFARYWDLIGNSGRFSHVRQWIVSEKEPFFQFLTLSDWLFVTIGRTHKISLRHQFEWLNRGLVEALGMDQERVLMVLKRDYEQGTLREPPDFLRSIVKKGEKKKKQPLTPARQARHLS